MAITRSTSSASTDSGRPSADGDLEGEPEPLGVLTRGFDGLRREVRGGDLQVGALGEQRQRDRAGAGADLVHAGALGQLGADLDQQLGLAARPEDALVDVDLEVAEGRAAEDVGHRLAFDPALDVGLDLRGGLAVDLAGALHAQLAGRDAKRVGDQDFGLGASVLDSGGGDALGRVVEDRSHGASRGPLALNVNSRHYRQSSLSRPLQRFCARYQ